MENSSASVAYCTLFSSGSTYKKGLVNQALHVAPVEAKEGLENELWRGWSDGKLGEWALLYICISMSSAHSPTFLSLHLRHSSFPNHSLTLPRSQFILQPFFRFSYVTSSSLNSPGEPPMFYRIRLLSVRDLWGLHAQMTWQMCEFRTSPQDDRTTGHWSLL